MVTEGGWNWLKNMSNNNVEPSGCVNNVSKISNKYLLRITAIYSDVSRRA
jgi:hypothetical protein